MPDIHHMQHKDLRHQREVRPEEHLDAGVGTAAEDTAAVAAAVHSHHPREAHSVGDTADLAVSIG